MCRLTKEVDLCDHQGDEECLLGRREVNEQTPQASRPTNQAYFYDGSVNKVPTGSSLTTEIQNLIKMNKNKALNTDQSLPEDKSTSDSNESTLLSNFGMPSKNLICQESSQKFGLINRKSFGKSVFHLVKEYDDETEEKEKQPTLSDISTKLDQLISSQKSILSTMVVQNLKSCQQIDSLKNHIKFLSEKIEESMISSIPNVKTVPIFDDKMESINKFSLLNFICAKATTFTYSIELSTPLEPTFVKERNFKADFKLVNKENGRLADFKLPLFLEMKLYSAENPPKSIELNTCGTKHFKPGNSIFKGNTIKELKSGYCSFEKMQIKEVSSHFRNGWVFIVVQPKPMSQTPGSLIEQIEPFILDNVIIKAKLNTKKKEDIQQQEETQTNDILQYKSE